MLAIGGGNHNLKILSQSAWFNRRKAGRQPKQRRASVTSVTSVTRASQPAKPPIERQKDILKIQSVEFALENAHIKEPSRLFTSWQSRLSPPSVFVSKPSPLIIKSIREKPFFYIIHTEAQGFRKQHGKSIEEKESLCRVASCQSSALPIGTDGKNQPADASAPVPSPRNHGFKPCRRARRFTPAPARPAWLAAQ
jgi:hypothetical protein